MILANLESELTDHNFISGTEMSVADIAMHSYIVNLQSILTLLGKDYFADCKHSKVLAWMASLSRNDVIKKYT